MTLLSDSYRKIAADLRHLATARNHLPTYYGLAGTFEELVETEQVNELAPAGAVLNLDFSIHRVQIVTLSQATLIGLTGLEKGPYLLVIAGAFSPTFTGVSWSGGSAPVPTATSGKADVYEFLKLSSRTLGRAWGQGFAW